MINISVYLNNEDMEFCDNENLLTVGSCGYYKLLTEPRYDSIRPAGRMDWQLLYLCNGSAHFTIDAISRTLSEGTLILYEPGRAQYDYYLLEENPAVYWLHFSGKNIPGLLSSLGYSGLVSYTVTPQKAYTDLFDHIIRELQLKQPNFAALANAYAWQLLAQMGRCLSGHSIENSEEENRLEQIVQMIHQDFGNNHTVEDYAEMCNVSIGWFIRSFKDFTGYTPQQYVMRVRINKAKELLAYSAYNVGEIGTIVGYENPLYFSRVFSHSVGMPPREYRKSIRAEEF